MSWQFWIDVGGTFTDCIAQSPDGTEHLAKVLSSGLTKGAVGQWDSPRQFVDARFIDSGDRFWESAEVSFLDEQGTVQAIGRIVSFDQSCGAFVLEEELPQAVRTVVHSFELNLNVPAPVLAIRKILGLGRNHELEDCCRVHLGTTRGTNALLTRQGARTALVTSIGFRDLLRIGDQSRPHLFQLAIEKPEPLFETSIEIRERTLADGTIEQKPIESQVKEQLQKLVDAGIESVAVCLIHGYRFSENEKIVGRIAREMAFADVRLSHEVAPLIKMVNRGETTVLDAYLNPVIARYLDEIQSQLSPESHLRLMTSYGGLVPRSRFSGKDSVLSGPAGGVVGAARVAQSAGFEKAIALDMGGTSTDVGRFDGELELEYETRKAGVRIVSPMMAIETVAAGGGSICKFDGAKLVVGPESAASHPGPACYGNGGPLTVTDLNLFLGRIVAEQFPFRLSRDSVCRRLDEIIEQMRKVEITIDREALATGLLQIANHNMASAIRVVSVSKGYDPREYVLVSFGGAGAQHCCAVADTLGMEKILDHPQGSLLSAVGIRLADQTATRVQTILKVLDESTLSDAEEHFETMRLQVMDELDREAASGPVIIDFQSSLDLRYHGTDAAETVFAAGKDFAGAFAEVHQKRYGYTQDRPIEIVAARVVGRIKGNRLSKTAKVEPGDFCESETRQMMSVPLHQRGSKIYQSLPAPVFDRTQLISGNQIAGPAIVASKLTSTIVDPGWKALVLPDGQLLLERVASLGESSGSSDLNSSDTSYAVADPIELEIFNNHFSTIARQMGIALQKTSTSVNVKERLDYSCAIFSRSGSLVVNAPHIPVHLGAMSETVRYTIADNPVVNRGDVFVTNDPYRGGSHLPDVTLVTPVFTETEAEPVFWVASRSHHAEIGGKSPGSMPADATRLAEEGVLISNFKLIDAGRERFDELRQLLTEAPLPSRMPDENLMDIAAQVAANRSGQEDLLGLVGRHGLSKVHAYMDHIQNAAERKVRLALENLPNGTFEFVDAMDNGSTIRVAIQKVQDSIEIDFAGTDPVMSGNLNANRAIVSAAVMYVMRLLIDEDIPLNEGVMKPVSISVPESFLNPSAADDPVDSPAIVGGNVETSQRVVDVLLGAMGLAAASCGTMNNWLMGNENFGYYETVGGGSGATVDCNGADAVHTHMTNTRLTDPEILETRYPVVLREFAIRKGSGGKGRCRGGDGMLRSLEFRQPLTVSLLTSRRSTQPFGLDGGEAGEAGKNLLQRHESEQTVELESQCEVKVEAGDRLTLLTPGGGGFGSPGSSED
jgi:5-oxoprolinase (ATP-hydrolysing)